MDIIDPSIDPKEVELRDEEKKIPEKKTTIQELLIVDVKITFCTHVGWNGVLVMLFSLGIAGLFVYITSLYTKKFQAWHRPGVWVFMVFAVLWITNMVSPTDCARYEKLTEFLKGVDQHSQRDTD